MKGFDYVNYFSTSRTISDTGLHNIKIYFTYLCKKGKESLEILSLSTKSIKSK